MSTPLLVEDITTGYTRAPALRGVTIEVGPEEIVGVLGANGAGKTTLLRAVSGAMRAWSGSVQLDGFDVTLLPPWARVKRGLAHVLEGRHVFTAMTVADNLRVAGLVAGRKAPPVSEVYELFPRLEERHDQLAGTLSGGEQQMLAIGRVLMTRPKVILADEPSAGLSPVVVQQVVAALDAVRRQGVGVLIVEQSPYAIAEVVDWVYLIEQGRLVGSGSLAQLGGAEKIADLYLGVH